MSGVARDQLRRVGVATLGRLPRVGQAFDRPRLEPLKTSGMRLYRWNRARLGSSGKPANLGQVPWDYVKANEDRIPFLGLREYWYPGLISKKLRHNESELVTLCGENLVFFRDETGRARALQGACPHRKALLSLGQVGAFRPGTITCRYHGLTLDGDGKCVAVLVDGPDSPAVGKVNARSYPTEEVGGVIWVYMGERTPRPVLDSIPHAREFLLADAVWVHTLKFPVNYLGTFDNNTDPAHASILHRTCPSFINQRLWDDVGVEELESGGLHVYLKGLTTPANPTQGKFGSEVDDIEWHLPNWTLVPAEAAPSPEPFVTWTVPQDIDTCVNWLFFPCNGSLLRRARWKAWFAASAAPFSLWPGSITMCVVAGDGAMLESQGVIPNWSTDHLIGTDRGVSRARRMLKDAYAQERAERRERQDSQKRARGDGRRAESRADPVPEAPVLESE
ncbi:Rieske 2Fe-2S domain-containing protein [Mycolicibacterium moriokaense]|uniref:Rieske-like 2Fe-2S protein n=1 Tax=Mycolicibacterium moriokaense TaxID=39691 RepID=A0A318H779_9MYCO|nr:Rieske 2Fe-2S domain-containing protein [Mycolicibacterium moriokaense]PXW99860.1 Rieske-like 2Fe-2S protein [Mycolicibacterium moriokaense]